MTMNDELFARVTKAKADQVHAATELWNSRLELLQRAGDVRGLLEQLRSPVELAGDNCGCNSACSIPEGMGQFSSPAAR